MSSDKKRDHWLQGIKNRQRNVVFPDTVRNEAEFWRNLIRGKLNRIQQVAVVIFLVYIIGTIAFITIAPFSKLKGPILGRVLEGLSFWLADALLVLVIFGPLFALLVWGTRRRGKHGRGTKKHPR
jgi:hypothetical protein